MIPAVRAGIFLKRGNPMIGYIRFADALSPAFGKAFAWLILLMAV